MSDVYSDLNIKNGAKIVLGESGVSIDSSGCVVLSDGCSSDLSDMATKSYVDSKLSDFCTSGCVACYSGCEYLLFCPEDPHNCGTVAKLKADYQNTLLSANTCYRLILQSEQECVITHSGWGIHFGIGGTYQNPDVKFSLPEKDSGTYTLATTDDITPGGSVSGDYLQLNSTEKQNIASPIQFDGSVYLNDGGCGIIMSNCEAFVYSNATFRLPEVTTGRYTLATTDDISSLCDADYLKLCCSTTQTVSGLVYFSCGINVNDIGISHPISLSNNNCFAFYNGATFQLPNKQQCGIYTFATTEDISGSGCCYPTCYPLYSECSKLVSVFCYESSYNRAALRTCGTGIYINTEQAGDIHIDSYKNVIINAGCSIFFSNDTSAFCMFVPSHLPYMEDTIESTIVTSPGYTESGCGLQICVLTQSEYSSMSQHGMTTLYFIKPEI